MKLYNTLSNKLEVFTPQRDNVSMYVCGITPYDTTHLGHAFTYMSFDVLQRYLKYKGYKVTYVQNVTDIDDDILKRAAKVKKDWKELGKFWTDRFLKDIKALNIELPTHYVKATDAIPQIIGIVKQLQEKSYAYAVNGTVYFDTKKDKDYGKLSKYSETEMIKLSKERGANPDDPNKKNPLDFILWQKSLPEEPYWQSPWGKGRPGWHIECTAMIYKYLYNNIDIHGGGTDLVYPHHESEIAQSESVSGVKPFVKYWMHTGAVSYQGEKMSKSLGNLILVSDLLKKYSPNAIRYMLLKHHYREPWEYHEEELKEAEEKVSLIQTYMKSLPETKNDNNTTRESFVKALENDLNVPSAIQILENAILKKENIDYKKLYSLLGFIF